jgi:hypothetical protein
MLSLLMVLMQKSIAKVTFEMLYFFVVWVCKISLKSMLQSYVSKFKLFIFHFRCNSLYNLNMFQYHIVLCFRVHFIMGSLTIFQMFYLSILSCLCYVIMLGFSGLRFDLYHVVQSITSRVFLYWYVLCTYASTYYFQVIT